MSKIKDYSLDHPGEVISGSATPKENPFAIRYKDHLINIRQSKKSLLTNLKEAIALNPMELLGK